MAGTVSFVTHSPIGAAVVRSVLGYSSTRLAVTLAGIDFENPLGMAAGFDKTGRLYPFLSCAGFGSVECGTFTRHAQNGNPKPRLFRFPEQQALVNRMGFNNPGAEEAARIIATQKHAAVRGINLGKSKITDLDGAAEDYLYSLRALVGFADYVAINVSSPNTPDLRKLQEKKRLSSLLRALRKECAPPLILKIAPDLTTEEIEDVLDASSGIIDALILCNTTIDKSSVPGAESLEGGLSGKPLAARSLALLRQVRAMTGGKLPLISAGGIDSAESAIERIRAGASLIQIYTSYIYGGPDLPRRILSGIDRYLEKNNMRMPDLIGADAR